jgi:ABC-type transport system substrate-binding protein
MMRRNLTRLVFDTLTVRDENGAVQPSLADSWISSSGGQRWQFTLRRGVTFSDGSLLTADVAAAALRKANPGWRVTSQAELIAIELESPVTDFPSELALPRNAIVRRGEKLLGTGPFVVSQWEPRHRLSLVARDDYRDGRVFLDAIEIEMGKPLREQNIAFDLGRTDVIEIAPEQSRHAATEGRRVANSSPAELMALWFTRDIQSEAEQKLRTALFLSIDRPLMNRVLLQNDGEPAGSLLPTWMTGYGFVFSPEANQNQAKQLRAEAGQTRPWTLGYDNEDALARVVAERVLLNARDAGLNIQTTTAPSADIRLVRIPLTFSNGRIGLEELCSALGISPPKFPGSNAENVYSVENTLLQSRRVIPLLHLRYVWGVSTNVQEWSVGRDGSWNLPEVWLAGRQ